MVVWNNEIIKYFQIENYLPSIQNFIVFGNMIMTRSSGGFIWSRELIIFLERGKVIYQQNINGSFPNEVRDDFFSLSRNVIRALLGGFCIPVAWLLGQEQIHSGFGLAHG